MICPNCATEITKDPKFCATCGNKNPHYAPPAPARDYGKEIDELKAKNSELEEKLNAKKQKESGSGVL